MITEAPSRPWADVSTGKREWQESAARLKHGYTGLIEGLTSEFYSPFIGGPGSGG